MEISNSIYFNLDTPVIEKRKKRIREAFNYCRVDHIPVGIFAYDNRQDYSMQEIIKDKEKNLQFDLNCIEKSIKILPDDYIPFLKPETGNITIPSILGCEVDFGRSKNDYPRVKEPVISKIKQLDNFPSPEIKVEMLSSGLMPLNLEKIFYYRSITKDKIDITGIDLGGALIIAETMMEPNLFYTALLDEEERMLSFINKIGDLHLIVMEQIVNAAGGLDKMTSSDWDPFWFPEGYKGCCCDDICSHINPDLFNKYSKPNNKKIFDKFGYGEMHNCGPHPCAREYIDYGAKKLKSINVAPFFTINGIEDLLKVVEGTGSIITLDYVIEELNWGMEKTILNYRDIVEKAVKYNVIIIPSYFPIDTSIYSDDEIRGIYNEFVSINTEYSKSLKLK